MKNMKKTLLLGLCTLLCATATITYAVEDFSFDLDAAINEADGNTGNKTEEVPAAGGSSAKAIFPSVDAQSYLDASNNMYYDPALIESLITKYKEKNYVGCIQEAQSKMKQENPNPVAMYYMALSYTQIGDVKAALDLYDAILKLQPSETLTECATRGRDCLIGGPACPNKGVEGADIDAQIQEYKNTTRLNFNSDGTTLAISQIIANQESKILPDMLVKTQSAEKKTLDVDKNIISEETIPEISNSTQEIPNSDEVAQALKTLQNAGIAVTIQPTSMPNMQNYNPQMAQMSMLLNSNNSNHNFDMLPYMMMQNQGQNNSANQYNSQMLQAMMMNYMMPSLDFNTKDKD